MSPPIPVYPPPQPAGSSFVTAGGEEPAVTLPFSNMGMMSVCLGSQAHWVPQAQPLTCFITCFTLVFVSSTRRFTPKAPGFSQSKIYQQKRSFQESVHSFSLSKACPPPVSFPALLTDFPHGLANEEMAPKAEEACEGRTRAHLFEVDSGALSTTPHPFSSLW